MGTNRFTNLSTSRFNPLSWEDVSRVPLSKRTQHNAQEKAKLELESNLAQIQSLEGHSSEVRKLQEEYQNKIDKFSNQLSTEGVSDMTKGDILKFNSQYKKDISPQGRLGQIQQAYLSDKEQKKSYLKNADKKHSQEKLLENWNSKRKDYYNNPYDDENNIKQPEAIGAVSYIDVNKDIQDTLKAAADSIIQKGGSHLQMTNIDGIPVMLNTKTNSIDQNNTAQLNSAIAELTHKYSQEGSEHQANATMYNYDIPSMVSNAAGKYQNIKSVRQNTKSAQILDNPFSKKPSNNNATSETEDILGGKGNSLNLFQDESGNIDYKNVENSISELTSSKDPEQVAKGRVLEKRYKRIKSDYNSIPSSEIFNKSKDSLNDEVLKLQGKQTPGTIGNRNSHIYTNDFSLNELIEGAENGSFVGSRLGSGHYMQKREDYLGNITYDLVHEKGGIIGKNISPDLYKKALSLSKSKKNYEEGLNKQLQHDRNNTVDFQMINLKASERTQIDNELKDAFAAFGTNEFKIIEGLVKDNSSNKTENLQSIDRSWMPYSGNWLSGDNSEKDQKLLMNTISNPNTKVHFLSMTSNNHTGKPAITIQVQPSDDDDNFSNKTLDLTIDLEDLGIKNKEGSKMSGLGNIQKLMVNKLKNKGGLQGKALAKRIEDRITYKNIKPTFSSDFAISDEIKKSINDPKLRQILVDKNLDINMIGNKYTLDISSDFENKESNYTSESMGWGDIVQIADDENTLSQIKTLSPALINKLVLDVKQLFPNVNNINDMNEEDIDQAVKYLAENNSSINTDNYFDLLNLLSNYK